MRKEQLLGSNYHYTKHPLSYFIDSMKRMGIGHIEFYGASPHMYVDDYTIGQARSVKRMLDAAGIQVECFTSEQCAYPISCSISEPVMRERSLKYYEKALELSYAVGSPIMQMMAGLSLIEDDKKEAWKWAAEGIYRVCKKAEPLGMTIILEADPICTVANAFDIRRMLDELQMPVLKGMLDFNQIYNGKEDFEEAVDVLKEDLYHVHMNDAAPDAFCLIPGHGEIPLMKYFEILDKKGYSRFVSPELWGTRYAMAADEAMEEIIEYFGNYLKEHKAE